MGVGSWLGRWKWRLGGRLGGWPMKIRSGPAAGMTLVAPRRYRRAYGSAESEPHVLAGLERLVEPGMVVVDVGAHVGYFTLALAALVGETGRVFAFEPLPDHCRAFRRTLAANRLSGVRLVEAAVGAAVGQVTLEEWRNRSMSRVARGGPSPFAIRRHRVPMTTLDDWATEQGELDRLDLVKIDAEGHELDVLAGAEGVLSRFRPNVVCELHRRADVPYQPRELVEWLVQRGYEAEPVAGGPDDSLEALVGRLEAARDLGGDMVTGHLLARPT